MNRLSLERLEDILSRAKSARIVVVGDLMLDVYLRGSASRISPEAPVPVVRVTEEWRALGGAANVASNVVAFGAACSMIGCVGPDSAGRELRQELSELSIETDGVVELLNRPTTVKTRVMARHQQVARYDIETEEDIDPATAALLTDTVARLLENADALVLEDYNKGLLTPELIGDCIRLARARGVPVIVDPKFRSFFAYRGATVFKPNLVELTAALRERLQPLDPAWMARTRTELGAEHLLVTLGEDGLALAAGDGEFMHVPTVARSVYDVSGAGDTVTAALAVALAAGATIQEAAVLANHAAGVEVGKAGVATVSPDELREVVAEHHASRLQTIKGEPQTWRI